MPTTTLPGITRRRYSESEIDMSRINADMHLRTKLGIAAVSGTFTALVALLIALGLIAFPSAVIAMSVMLALITFTAFAVRFAISYYYELAQSKITARKEEGEEEVANLTLNSWKRAQLGLTILSFLALVALIALGATGILPAISGLEVAALSMAAASIIYVKLDLYLKSLRNQGSTSEVESEKPKEGWFSKRENQGKFVLGLGLSLCVALAVLVALEFSIPALSLGLAVFSSVPLLLAFIALALAVCTRGFVLLYADGKGDKHAAAIRAVAAATTPAPAANVTSPSAAAIPATQPVGSAAPGSASPVPPSSSIVAGEGTLSAAALAARLAGEATTSAAPSSVVPTDTSGRISPSATTGVDRRDSPAGGLFTTPHSTTGGNDSEEEKSLTGTPEEAGGHRSPSPASSASLR